MPPTFAQRSAVPLSGRTIAIVLAVIFTAGLAARLEGVTSLSLCHFDEGVYVSSAQQMSVKGALVFSFRQALHAPPMYSWLAAGAFKATGSFWPPLAIAVTALLGALTPLALFGLGRRIGGVGFGLAAAALLAASDLHIAMSRMALTDVPLALWFTLAIWAAAELAPRPLAETAMPRLSGYLVLGVLLGLFVALAWNTKYNGWLPGAIVIGALVWTWRLGSPDVRGRRPYLVLAICLGAALSIMAFLPWYWHVQREHPGGYAAVIANHRSYLGNFWMWPERANRQLMALPALRHYGWMASLGLMTGGGVSLIFRTRGWRQLLVAAGVGTAICAAVGGGVDALLLMCGVAGIVPAMLSRRWTLVLAGVWMAAFVVLVPFYFPYVRLLTPAVPAAILLTLHLIWPAGADRGEFDTDETESQGARSAVPAQSLPWVTAGLLATIGIALLNPFGFVPTRELWDRWSPRSGYAQFADRVDVETPANAAIICQGQPPFSVYCPREWTTVFGNERFSNGLEGLSDDHPTYLALDFRWLHESDATARDDVVRWLHCLSPVAVIPFEPSIVMLLDHLPPEMAALKLHTPPEESLWTDTSGQRRVPVPPDIRSRGEDVIVLYQIDVARIRRER